jgi:hypothetical protein
MRASAGLSAIKKAHTSDERESKHLPEKVQTLFAKSLKNGAPEKIRTPNLLIRSLRANYFRSFHGFLWIVDSGDYAHGLRVSR